MKVKNSIPYGISQYITNRFRDEFLFELKDVKPVKGHLYYTVEVSKDNHIHTLLFDEAGKLVKDDTQQAFKSDDHDELGFEDMPE